MIDLSILEKDIDNLLASETEDSLLTWLYEKRTKDLLKRLGEGRFASSIDIRCERDFIQKMAHLDIVIVEKTLSHFTKTPSSDLNFAA